MLYYVRTSNRLLYVREHVHILNTNVFLQFFLPKTFLKFEFYNITTTDDKDQTDKHIHTYNTMVG